MNADLQRLIDLQRIDSLVHDAQRRIANEPDLQHQLDVRLEQARQHVATAKEKLAQNLAARREIEKEVAVHQTRLSKFRDQLMAVKTNVEYQAMQKEIAYAQAEVKALEDRILERMLEADELGASVKVAESDLASTQKAVDADRRTLTTEIAALKTRLDDLGAERRLLVTSVAPAVLATFERLAGRRQGVAVAEARDGICTICHVRLRPQVFNTVRRNEEIIQCDSCNRILYFAAAPAGNAATTAP